MGTSRFPVAVAEMSLLLAGEGPWVLCTAASGQESCVEDGLMTVTSCFTSAGMREREDFSLLSPSPLH